METFDEFDTKLNIKLNELVNLSTDISKAIEDKGVSYYGDVERKDILMWRKSLLDTANTKITNSSIKLNTLVGNHELVSKYTNLRNNWLSLGTPPATDLFRLLCLTGRDSLNLNQVLRLRVSITAKRNPIGIDTHILKPTLETASLSSVAAFHKVTASMLPYNEELESILKDFKEFTNLDFDKYGKGGNNHV